MGQKSGTRTPVIPTMRYADAPRMIEWLCTAFGFERQFVVPGDGGSIAHAQLAFGNGMIMLGSARDDEWGRLVKPVGANGVATGAVYLVVSDLDAHAARAKAWRFRRHAVSRMSRPAFSATRKIHAFRFSTRLPSSWCRQHLMNASCSASRASSRLPTR